MHYVPRPGDIPGAHDQLPPHIRKGIDDQLARIEQDNQITGERAGADFPRWLGWLILAGLLVVGMALLVLFVELGHQVNQPSPFQSPFHTPTTYGAPPA